MSRQSQHWNTTWVHEKQHQRKLLAKLQRIKTLQALIEEWESHPNPDYHYLRGLRRKLHTTTQQYENMRP